MRLVLRDTTYQQLADELASELHRQAAGARLPSEHELARAHGVSRITTRAALQELEQRHLVRRVRGRGTFVALRLEYTVSAAEVPSFSEVIRRQGHTPSQQVDAVVSRRATAAIRTALELEPAARVVYVSRRRFVDGDVVSTQEHWIPADLVPRLAEVLRGADSLYTAMVEHYGLDPRRWQSRAELATVPEEVAARLEYVGRPQAWHLESVNRCASTDRVVEVARSWLRTDAFRLRFEHGPGTKLPRGGPR